MSSKRKSSNRNQQQDKTLKNKNQDTVAYGQHVALPGVSVGDDSSGLSIEAVQYLRSVNKQAGEHMAQQLLNPMLSRGDQDEEPVQTGVESYCYDDGAIVAMWSPEPDRGIEANPSRISVCEHNEEDDQTDDEDTEKFKQSEREHFQTSLQSGNLNLIPCPAESFNPTVAGHIPRISDPIHPSHPPMQLTDGRNAQWIYVIHQYRIMRSKILGAEPLTQPLKTLTRTKAHWCSIFKHKPPAPRVLATLTSEQRLTALSAYTDCISSWSELLGRKSSTILDYADSSSKSKQSEMKVVEQSNDKDARSPDVNGVGREQPKAPRRYKSSEIDTHEDTIYEHDDQGDARFQSWGLAILASLDPDEESLAQQHEVQRLGRVAADTVTQPPANMETLRQDEDGGEAESSAYATYHAIIAVVVEIFRCAELLEQGALDFIWGTLQ